MVFVVNGRKCQLSREEVERAIIGIEPARGRHYFINIHGKRYPVKQVLYLSLREQCAGLSLLDFSDDIAKNVLSQIGFEIIL
jgi:5-methylcytosine-specific restriction protein B